MNKNPLHINDSDSNDSNELFRKAADDFEIPFDESFWESALPVLDEHLPEKKRRRIAGWYWLLGSVILLGIGGILATWYGLYPKENAKHTAQTTELTTNTNNPSSSQNNSIQQTTTDTNNNSTATHTISDNSSSATANPTSSNALVKTPTTSSSGTHKAPEKAGNAANKNNLEGNVNSGIQFNDSKDVTKKSGIKSPDDKKDNHFDDSTPPSAIPTKNNENGTVKNNNQNETADISNSDNSTNQNQEIRKEKQLLQLLAMMRLDSLFTAPKILSPITNLTPPAIALDTTKPKATKTKKFSFEVNLGARVSNGVSDPSDTTRSTKLNFSPTAGITAHWNIDNHWSIGLGAQFNYHHQIKRDINVTACNCDIAVPIGNEPYSLYFHLQPKSVFFLETPIGVSYKTGKHRVTLNTGIAWRLGMKSYFYQEEWATSSSPVITEGNTWQYAQGARLAAPFVGFRYEWNFFKNFSLYGQTNHRFDWLNRKYFPNDKRFMLTGFEIGMKYEI